MTSGEEVVQDERNAQRDRKLFLKTQNYEWVKKERVIDSIKYLQGARQDKGREGPFESVNKEVLVSAKLEESLAPIALCLFLQSKKLKQRYI